jgi:hypothetical protein
MTEAEWLTGIDPTPMLEFLRGKASDRKLRLLGVAIARASWDRLNDDRSRRAVEAAEKFADGAIDSSTLDTVVDGAWDVRDELWDAGHRDDRVWHAEAVGMTATVHEWSDRFNRTGPPDDYPFRIPSPAHCELARDIFGNPFRPVTFDPNWRTTTAIQLAQLMYDSRDFSVMPILADALEDAGCDHADVLDHCRGPGPHVRGCWVVDLVLGKE